MVLSMQLDPLTKANARRFTLKRRLSFSNVRSTFAQQTHVDPNDDLLTGWRDVCLKSDVETNECSDETPRSNPSRY